MKFVKLIKLKLPVILAATLAVFLSLLLLLTISKNQIIYMFERAILSNNSTDLFSCDNFSTQNDLTNYIENNINDDKKLASLKSYLSEINGFLEVTEVGNRCPGKYQYEIIFVRDSERIEIERILEDQRLNNIPVFLRNT